MNEKQATSAELVVKEALTNDSLTTIFEKIENGETEKTFVSIQMPIENYLQIEKEIPDFQRSSAQWDSQKAIDLFQTIANEEPLPKVILAKVEKENEVYLIDGQQRTNTFELLLSVLSADNQELINEFMIDIDLVSFNEWDGLADYYLRVNASSGLTQAQKLKAKMTKKLLSIFNQINYNDDLVQLLEKETDTDDKKLGKILYIKNGKTEEMSFCLLAIANTNKVTLTQKGFSTGVSANHKYLTSLPSEVTGIEKIEQFLSVMNKCVCKFENKTKMTRQQLICLLFQAYFLGKIDDIQLANFFYSTYKNVKQANGKIKFEENKAVSDIFEAGTGNNGKTMKEKYEKLCTYLTKIERDRLRQIELEERKDGKPKKSIEIDEKEVKKLNEKVAELNGQTA